MGLELRQRKKECAVRVTLPLISGQMKVSLPLLGCFIYVCLMDQQHEQQQQKRRPVASREMNGINLLASFVSLKK